jgi:hypothetical protein
VVYIKPPRSRADQNAADPSRQDAAAYRGAGGNMLLGAPHTFVSEHPFDPNSVKAVEAMKAFIKPHGSERHAQR